MKIVASIVLLSASLSAAGFAPERMPLAGQPSYEEPARAWSSIEEPAARQRCRDRIEQARAASGKPKLERDATHPDEPLMMYAVDRRVDGCGVLVPVADPSDIRQAPAPRTPQIIPAK